HRAHCMNKAIGKKPDVKPQMPGVVIFLLFLFRQQVEEQRGNACALKLAGDELVARAVSAAATAVSEQNQPLGVLRDRELSFKSHWAGGDLNFRNRPSHERNIGLVRLSATGNFGGNQ